MTERQIDVIAKVLLALFFILAIVTFPLWIWFYIQEKRNLAKVKKEQWRGYV